MSDNKTSYWKLAGTDKWVCEVRIVQPNGQIKKIQRRGDSKSEVKQIAANLRNLAAKNIVALDRKFTLAELCAPYIEHKTHQVRQGTLGNYMHLVRQYVLPRFGNRRIQSIEPSEITTWLNELRRSGLTPNTVNTIRARFHDLLQFAVARRYISDNPLTTVPPHKADETTATQVRDPWDLIETRTALAAFANSTLDFFVAAALATGMRKGEILALRWSDLDLQSRTITVSKSRGEKRILGDDGVLKVKNIESGVKTKTSNRTLKMPQVVFQAVIRTLANRGEVRPEDYVVIGPKGGPLSQSVLRRHFALVCELQSLRFIRIHDLRHTAAVLGLVAGAALEEVSQGLGHAGVEITKRTYAPIVPKLAERFVDKLDAALADGIELHSQSNEQ